MYVFGPSPTHSLIYTHCRNQNWVYMFYLLEKLYNKVHKIHNTYLSALKIPAQ